MTQCSTKLGKKNNKKNSNIKIYYLVKLMYGNTHTLKFQYTALETRKYDQLKTTETDKGNYLSHEKRVIVGPLLHKCKIFYFLQNHIPKKLLAKVLTLTILGSLPVNLCLTVIEQHCYLILNHHIQALFSLEKTEGDSLPSGRKNSPGYVSQATGFCINCLAFGSHTDRNDGLGFRE